MINHNGDIVYSDKKETDFATNLRLGPYARTSLATAFKEAQKQNDGYVAIADFSFYDLSYGEPAAFAATPIYNNTELIGVLVVHISTDRLNAVMTSKRQWEAEGRKQTLAALVRGNFFGYSVLLANAPSATGVVAAEDLKVLVLETDAVQKMLNKNPRFAQ